MRRKLTIACTLLGCATLVIAAASFIFFVSPSTAATRTSTSPDADTLRFGLADAWISMSHSFDVAASPFRTRQSNGVTTITGPLSQTVEVFGIATFSEATLPAPSSGSYVIRTYQLSLWPVALVLLLPAAHAYAYRPWKRRRRLRRGLCPDCGYDLRGATSATCSECGWSDVQPAPEASP